MPPNLPNVILGRIILWGEFQMAIRLGFVGVALLAATPALATTSISGAVNVDANSKLGAALDAHTDAASAAAPASVTLNASAKASVSDAGATNTSFTTITANWLSADSGSVDLDWGWNINADGYGGDTSAFTNQSYPSNWQYTFIASGNGTFSGTYSVVGDGDKFGLQPLYTTWDWTSGTLGGDVFDPTGSGTFSVALIAGQTYTMSVANFGNLGNGAGFVANGSVVSNFDWHIDYSAAPEPASWAMMLGGFGLVGGALRSRRRVALSFG